MTASPGHSAGVNVCIEAAKESDAPLLGAMLSEYVSEFSQWQAVQPDANGHYSYPDLPLYWSQPDRYPLLISVEDQAAGFALVRRGSRISGDAGVWDMAEFCVLPPFRLRGIGVRAASAVFQRFHGAWEVRVTPANTAAVAFWNAAVTSFAGRPVEAAEITYKSATRALYSFLSPAACVPSMRRE